MGQSPCQGAFPGQSRTVFDAGWEEWHRGSVLSQANGRGNSPAGSTRGPAKGPPTVFSVVSIMRRRPATVINCNYDYGEVLVGKRDGRGAAGWRRSSTQRCRPPAYTGTVGIIFPGAAGLHSFGRTILIMWVTYQIKPSVQHPINSLTLTRLGMGKASSVSQRWGHRAPWYVGPKASFRAVCQSEYSRFLSLGRGNLGNLDHPHNRITQRQNVFTVKTP